ncbi:MAG: TonB-dependent receptor [Terracidiphilus sp.]
MKAKLLLAILPAACLCGPAQLSYAQRATIAVESSSPTGRIAGAVKDPSGAVLPGANIEISNISLSIKQSSASNAEGQFGFDHLPTGCYLVKVTAKGFETGIISDLHVAAGAEAEANITLRIASIKTSVAVNALEAETVAGSRGLISDSEQAQSRSTAEIVSDAPGVSLRENGQLAAVPLLHGLGDERAKLVVNGMTVSLACPNHMNPPLTYLAPAAAAQVTVMAGITPVSMGGDSVGGTIAVDSRMPVFATAGERTHQEGASTGFYRSNGQNYGGSLRNWVAGSNLGIGYTGSWANNSDYTDGSGHKVTSTYAQATDHTVILAAQKAGNLITLEASLHHTPYEGFVSAQMDMVRNDAETLNLHYQKTFTRGALDSHIFWQNTRHSMNIGKDKSTFPMAMFMPMNSHGRDQGYNLNFEAPLSARQTLRAGNELHRFVLDDRWPPVAGTAPMMAPDMFVSINNGRRIRVGSYGELASKWNGQWSTLFGLRTDTVWTNAGPAQGYSTMMYGADAAAFNASNRAHADEDFDATALVRYEPNRASTYEFGFARKTRAPNLYERYAWSTSLMASGMIGWFGDGNYYVGDVTLKPEIAHTFSGTAIWRGRASKAWEIKLTPHETFIQDYIDVNQISMVSYEVSNFAQLQFANHNARIYGIDYSAHSILWKSERLGQGKLNCTGGWMRGERLDAQTSLYQMMPLHARLNLDEELKGFTGGFSIQALDRKSRVDPNRLEQVTPGYTLYDLHTGYHRGYLEANAAADNLFNRNYELPLGGVNFDDFMASGRMSQIKPLTGRGRLLSFSLTARF